jgi:hypothetical protein
MLYVSLPAYLPRPIADCFPPKLSDLALLVCAAGATAVGSFIGLAYIFKPNGELKDKHDSAH